MNRIPASLLYLTVYNPTLKPTGPIPDGDEDAEEQAQILFYTSRERAVSRDRMLRQVGLAKALVNFTEMFNPGGEPCENVHSQTRRMVMISPEPRFWIHACVELPKTPRQPVKSPSKGKKPEPIKQEPSFDYHDGLVYDIALKAHLQRAYELFKIRHGSLTSILDTIGQQALELQLERFFTVWAWSWDAEEQPDFRSHLGRPLHPHYKALASQFESLDDVLPIESIPLVLSPSGLIPSPRFSELGPSPALVQHLRSILPEYVPSAPDPHPDSESDSNATKAATSNGNSGQQPTGGFSLPTIPMPAVTLNVDVRNMKWNWPGYLTFGKNSKDKEKQKGGEAAVDEQKPDSELEPKPDTGGEGVASSDAPVAEGGVPSPGPLKEEEKVEVEVEVDTLSLADAMESEAGQGSGLNAHSPGDGTPNEAPPPLAVRAIGPTPDDDITPTAVRPPDPDPARQGDNEMSQRPPSTGSPSSSSEEELHPATSEPPPPLVTFSQTLVHLAPSGHPLRTTRRRLYYLTKEDITVAIVDDEGLSLQLQEDLQSVVEAALNVAENLRVTIYDEERRSTNGTPVTAAKILQPKDTHVLSVGDYTVTGVGGFKSNSEYLYSGQQLLEGDQDIVEVFSRDLNPQHWHVARRGNVLDSEGRTTQSITYYHSARKESSLADVDNEVAAVVRKFTKSYAKSVSRADTIIAPQPEVNTRT